MKKITFSSSPPLIEWHIEKDPDKYDIMNVCGVGWLYVCGMILGRCCGDMIWGSKLIGIVGEEWFGQSILGGYLEMWNFGVANKMNSTNILTKTHSIITHFIFTSTLKTPQPNSYTL